MLHTRLASLHRLDKGDVATVVLGVLVASMSAAIIILLYLPVRG